MPQPRAQQAFVKGFEAIASVERRIPGHVGKGGQGQFPGACYTRLDDQPVQQHAPDTLPLCLPAHGNLMNVQCLLLIPCARKTQNLSGVSLGQPACTAVDAGLMGGDVQHITCSQPGQRRQAGESLSG